MNTGLSVTPSLGAPGLLVEPNGDGAVRVRLACPGAAARPRPQGAFERRGRLFVGGLASTRLVRLVVESGRVVGEEHLLADRGQRIRDVRQGPDGALYVVTDGPRGELLRIAPRQ